MCFSFIFFPRFQCWGTLNEFHFNASQPQFLLHLQSLKSFEQFPHPFLAKVLHQNILGKNTSNLVFQMLHSLAILQPFLGWWIHVTRCFNGGFCWPLRDNKIMAAKITCPVFVFSFCRVFPVFFQRLWVWTRDFPVDSRNSGCDALLERLAVPTGWKPRKISLETRASRWS